MKWLSLEDQRLALQTALDAGKTSRARNELGQFATPTPLARDVLTYGLSLLPDNVAVRFIDPAIGTGAFYSALETTAGRHAIAVARGIEIDPHYAQPASALWAGTRLSYQVGDFTKQYSPTKPSERFNLLICNPPYVRHHHIDGCEKRSLQLASETACGVRVQGLAGLYCYFMALAHPWMSPGGVAGWLIPSEFMDVNYGTAIKRYLSTKVTLLRIHRFDPNDVQFDDALVSSAVVWIRNELPPLDHQVEFTYGGSLKAPVVSRRVPLATLEPEGKWTRYPLHMDEVRAVGATVGSLFKIQRGIATGDNSFFVMSPKEARDRGIPSEFLKPILPGTRHITSDEIMADDHGQPMLDRQLLLFSCRSDETLLREKYPKVWKYLESGRQGDEPVAERYLCRARRPWYSQEQRAPAPLLCSYMGRSDKAGKKPFRFFLNHSQAIAGNVYLMLYPKPELRLQMECDANLLRQIWAYLNTLHPEALLGEGRVYGGGLHKIEPKELAKVVLPDLGILIPTLRVERAEQLHLFDKTAA